MRFLALTSSIPVVLVSAYENPDILTTDTPYPIDNEWTSTTPTPEIPEPIDHELLATLSRRRVFSPSNYLATTGTPYPIDNEWTSTLTEATTSEPSNAWTTEATTSEPSTAPITETPSSLPTFYRRRVIIQSDYPVTTVSPRRVESVWPTNPPTIVTTTTLV